MKVSIAGGPDNGGRRGVSGGNGNGGGNGRRGAGAGKKGRASADTSR
jgi:hypothetical protein